MRHMEDNNSEAFQIRYYYGFNFEYQFSTGPVSQTNRFNLFSYAMTKILHQ